MIIKTQAIALKTWPFSETSHVVTWLTADHGKIATIIKGAQRPRNGFLGKYDLFYTCELLFYLRLFQGLHIVKECFPLKCRSTYRSYWPGTACASYFAGLTARVTPFYAPQRNIYALLEAALDFFAGEENPPPATPAPPACPPMPERRPGSSAREASPGGREGHGRQILEIGLFWFELKLLGMMGFAPRLSACLQCRRPLSPSGDQPAAERENASIAFSVARGGVLCGRCAGQYDANALIRIAPDSLALLRFWQSARKIHAIRNIVCRERQLSDVRLVLGNFLQHHLETENIGRESAISILGKYRQLQSHPLKM